MTDNLCDWNNIYHKKIANLGYKPDISQLEAISFFYNIEKELNNKQNKVIRKISSLFIKVNTKRKVKGLYLHGNVGRGKTFLIDLFCEHTSFSVKRIHFHNFMKEIHDNLREIKERENPLDILANNFSKSYRILCLDEFMVSDITDAMILYGLLKGLVNNGVVIITTTNIVPDDLYKDGLQRERFLPAIELIKDSCVIFEMDKGQDFRKLCLERHKRFFSPLDDSVEKELEQMLLDLSTHYHIERNSDIKINSRKILFVAKSKYVIWFDFVKICDGFRSQLDYIELAKKFKVIIITNIPILDDFKEDAAKRFLLLVDELYDKRIDLILSSEIPIERIYKGKKIIFEFERLQSRLFEMQSPNYRKDHK